MTDNAPCQNTDREIYRGPSRAEWGDDDRYYADSIHVTEGGGIGINCGGYVIVKPLRDWHALAQAVDARVVELQDCLRELCGIVDNVVAERWEHVHDLMDSLTTQPARTLLESALNVARPALPEAAKRAEAAVRARKRGEDNDLCPAAATAHNFGDYTVEPPKMGIPRAVIDHIAEVGVDFAQDGNQVCATFGDHIDLQQSPAGFGENNREALRALVKAWLADSAPEGHRHE